MAYPLPEKPSIVVLPFKNMSGDPKENYFSDGLTEQIITTLSVYPRIFVITRQSAFHYKKNAVEIRQVAEELGVRYVLTGGVQKSGDKMRITVQLIDALSGSYIWSERYDRQLTDIFLVQDEITANVLNAMVAELTEGEQARRWTQKKYNLKGLEKHYRAQGFFCRHTREDYEKAIQVSPNFIAAHLYLSACYSSIDHEADAHVAAKEVLRIDPKLSIESYATRLRYKNKADIDRELNALRKAGLPEKSTS